MDIVEFAEQTYEVKLYEWQKEYLRTLDTLYKQGGDIHVVMNKGVGRMFTYFKLKELFEDGPSLNSHN